MPITYERAFGGVDQEDPNPRKHRIDSRNPVGTGVATRKRNLIGKPAHNNVSPAQKAGEGLARRFRSYRQLLVPAKGTGRDLW